MIAEILFGRGERAATKHGNWTVGNRAIDRALGFFGIATASGEDVTEANALNYAACWAATRLLCASGSQLPLNTYKLRENGKGKDLAFELPLFRVLHDTPNGEMGSMMFRAQAMQQQINAGNCYAEIERGGKNGVQTIGLNPIHHSRVTLRRVDAAGNRSSKGQLVYDVASDGGALAIRFDKDEMFHVPSMMSDDGITGKGVITHARESIGFGKVTERHGAAFFGSGGMPPIVVKYKNKMSKEARTQFRDEWKEIHQPGSSELALLTEDASLEKLSMSEKDNQFLETRQHNVEEIARWYGVPPHMIGDLRRATFSNIEQQNIGFVVHSLIPWLKLWEEEAERKLLSKAEQGKYEVKHTVDALLRGEAKARQESLEVQARNGVRSRNEWRELEDLNPIEGGDEPFIMSNMTTVQRVIDGTVKGDAPVQLASLPPADDARAARLKIATGEVLREVVERLLVKEIEAAGRAANNPKEFIGQMDKFYEAHEGRCLKALRAPLTAHLVSLGQEPSEAMLVALVKVQIEESRTLLLAACECQAEELADRVAECVGRWAEDRTNIDLGAIECLA